MTDKVEFASPDWIAAITEILERNLAGADLSGRTITIAEEFTDSPAHLAPEGTTTIAWYFRVSDDGVEVHTGVPDSADLRTTVDYDAVLPIARMIYGTTPEALAEVQRRRDDMVQRGLMKREGDERALPPELLPRLFQVHNDIAERTA